VYVTFLIAFFMKSVDYITISDNYWLGTSKPCLTYGLRWVPSILLLVLIDEYRCVIHPFGKHTSINSKVRLNHQVTLVQSKNYFIAAATATGQKFVYILLSK
jgi:hypothetical protein